MDFWTGYVDNYCERLEPGFWAEPVNAVTNAAFIVAAVFAWRALGKDKFPVARVLTVILCLIGIGSFLFHTFATPWAGTADVLPIAAFVLVYLYAANRYFVGLGKWTSLGLTLLFFPYAPLAMFAIQWAIPPIGSSAAYGTLVVLLLLYAAILRRRLEVVSNGLLVGAAILSVSITFRTIDEPLCPVFAMGTHGAWHILNSIMLTWMILVLRDQLRRLEA